MTDIKNITVETAYYEFALGRKPRGVGYWVFEIDGEEYRVPERGGNLPLSFTDAKKEARKIAKKVGAYRVKVLP